MSPPLTWIPSQEPRHHPKCLPLLSTSPFFTFSDLSMLPHLSELGEMLRHVLKQNNKNTCWMNCCCYCFVAKLCPTLCDPLDCSTLSFPVLHCLQEFAQMHVHWVGDACQSSHPLLPSSPALSLSQHESFPMSQLFASGCQSVSLLSLSTWWGHYWIREGGEEQV